MGANNSKMCQKPAIGKGHEYDSYPNGKRIKIKKVNLAAMIPVVIGKTTFYATNEAHKLRIMQKYAYLLTKPQLNRLRG